MLFFPAPAPAGPPPDPEKPVHLSMTFDGTGYVNSGFLQHQGDTVSITFTKPGTYQALCLLHPEHMKGTIIVNPTGALRSKTDQDYHRDALAQIQDFKTKEAALRGSIQVPAEVLNSDGTHTYTVYAGYGDAKQGIDLMSLIGGKNMAIKMGDSVRFIMDKNVRSVPHTITFLSGDDDPEFVIPQPQPNGLPKLITAKQLAREVFPHILPALSNS